MTINEGDYVTIKPEHTQDDTIFQVIGVDNVQLTDGLTETLLTIKPAFALMTRVEDLAVLSINRNGCNIVELADLCKIHMQLTDFIQKVCKEKSVHFIEAPDD